MNPRDPYNHPGFPVESDVTDFAQFPSIMSVGDRAPDPELTDLETGESVQLSDYSRRGILIVEFGSIA